MTIQNSSLAGTLTSASVGVLPPSVVHKSVKPKPGTQKTRALGFAVLHSVEETPTECAFERFVAEHAIPEQLWPNSIELRQWVKRNASYRYVPEPLLAAFDITINDNFSWTGNR